MANIVAAVSIAVFIDCPHEVAWDHYTLDCTLFGSVKRLPRNSAEDLSSNKNAPAEEDGTLGQGVFYAWGHGPDGLRCNAPGSPSLHGQGKQSVVARGPFHTERYANYDTDSLLPRQAGAC
ncbi:hypothetical protein MAE02_58850 [Microvirga aerophila]|uniref:Uncharacterized protein n=1 Tax=Microvirga aerophila TaxID=670291 RepID=A0A512C1Y4_9HYPH|nr:hypothetical protein MAE02_58850 [Microvirga aerophila]